MTRDYAISRAKAMREGQIRMLKVANNTRYPSLVRYEAVVMAEEYEEAARRFDKYADQESAK